MYVDVSPMDNAHNIIAKMLKQNIDCSVTESVMGDREEPEAIFVDRSSTRSELRNCMAESVEQTEVACIAEMLCDVMNEQTETPLCFHTAAYEANFYWALYGDVRNEIAVKSRKHALDICWKWLSYAESIKHCFNVKFGCGLQGLPVIISNGWATIFDKYIRVLLGLLSLVKTIRNSGSRSSYKLSNGGTAPYVVVHVEAIDFLRYINYQCDLHLVTNCLLNNSFEFRKDVAGMLLNAAIRISTKLFKQST